MKKNCIIKSYPNGKIKVKKTKFLFNDKKEEKSKFVPFSEYNEFLYNLKKANYEQDYAYFSNVDKIQEKLMKTKEKVYDIAFSNDWNYFLTITFNEEKVDRFSFEDTSKKIRKYLNNYKNKHDYDFKYLIVHECHKNGAFHYHGLLYLSHAKTLKDSTKRDNKGNIIYNWETWKNGFSTLTKINNLEASCNYILKYLNKDIDKEYVKGRRRYYYSQNCLKPQRTTELDYDTSMLELSYESMFSIGYESVEGKSLDEVFDNIIVKD